MGNIMAVWELPVLAAVAVLDGMKLIYGISLWKGQDTSLSGIWKDKLLYGAAGLLVLAEIGVWALSGKQIAVVRYADLLYTYGILAAVDVRRRIVPDGILVCFFVGQMLLGAVSMVPEELFFLCLTGGILLVLFLAFAWISKGKIGMGDARLLGVTAMIAGWSYTLQLLVMAMALSFFYSVCLLVFCRKSVRTEFPFVPFLAVAMAVWMAGLL